MVFEDISTVVGDRRESFDWWHEFSLQVGLKWCSGVGVCMFVM